ncbi:hypothetical protein [Sphingomonas solaris]|uniref:hypothetical protein n=1 Tax=Alterirhizorhabdus solaris TaxID=2529389 RepID=UPI001EF089A4|nr:hypothetical protein [Sphingomonas solaris]
MIQRRWQTAFATGIAVTLLTGCATPSTQISTALTRYGLEAQRADCVGSDLSSHLSINQLQQLGRAAKAYRTNDSDPAHLTASDLMRVAVELKDPAVPLAVAGAGVRCGLVAGGL